MLKVGDKITFTRAAMGANNNHDYRKSGWQPTVIELVECVPLCCVCHRWLIAQQPWIVSPAKTVYPAKCDNPDRHGYAETYLYLIKWAVLGIDGEAGGTQAMINEHEWILV